MSEGGDQVGPTTKVEKSEQVGEVIVQEAKGGGQAAGEAKAGEAKSEEKPLMSVRSFTCQLHSLRVWAWTRDLDVMQKNQMKKKLKMERFLAVLAAPSSTNAHAH